MGKFVNFCAGAKIEVIPARHVPHLLINVPNDGINAAVIKGVHKLVTHLETEVLFQDSGGFQILMAVQNGKNISFDSSRPLTISETELNITPYHVVETATKLKPHIMTSLDYPINTISGENEQEKEFMDKLGYNALWAHETAELREKYCPEVKLLIPIQCYTLTHLEMFSKLIRGVNYDGFSMPLRNLSITQTALFLLRFYQMGIKMVHLLGSASFFSIALGTYMARHYFDWVSLDATSWREQAQHAGYLNPYDLTNEHVGDTLIIDDRIRMFCPCPFCKDRTFTSIKNLPYTDKTAFLRSHNFWVTENIANELYAASSDIGTFEKILHQKTKRTKKIDEIINCLTIMDVMKDEDLQVLSKILRV